MKRAKAFRILAAVVVIGLVVTLILMKRGIVPSHWIWPTEQSTQDGQSSEEMETLKRLIAHAGVLEFRIAPTLPGGAKGTELTEAEYETYMNRLTEYNPLTTRSANEKYLWFPVHDKCRSLASDLVVGERGDKKYILLFNQSGYTILNDPDSKSWSVSAYPTRDRLGKLSVGFELGARGARLMGRLTGAHKDHFLAVLVGDEVYSVPVIKTTIYDRGVIEGNFTAAEVDELIRTLEAGSLPSRVGPYPVSKYQVIPTAIN